MSSFELREAARFNGYTFEDWCRLTHRQRVASVAYMRAVQMRDRHVDSERAWALTQRANRSRGT